MGEISAIDPVKGDGGGGTKWKDSKHYLKGENQQDLEEIREEADNVLGFTIDKNKELVTTLQTKAPTPKMEFLHWYSLKKKKDENISTTHSFVTWLESQCLPIHLLGSVNSVWSCFFRSPFAVLFLLLMWVFTANQN